MNEWIEYWQDFLLAIPTDLSEELLLYLMRQYIINWMPDYDW